MIGCNAMQRKNVDISNFATYEQAAQWASENGIKTFRQWWSTPRPGHIPADPRKYPEFSSWGVFLGTYRRKRNAPYLPIEQAAEYVRTLKLKSNLQWKAYVKAYPQKIPTGIPKDPQSVYAEEFKRVGGWSWYLGNQYLSYEEAREYIQKLRSQGLVFTNSWEFREWARSPNRPEYFPSYPDRMYTDEWEGYPVFLGYSPTSNTLVNEIAQELDQNMSLYLALSQSAGKNTASLSHMQTLMDDHSAAPSLKNAFDELARRINRGIRPAQVAFDDLISLL
jgi:hypothetical protein